MRNDDETEFVSLNRWEHDYRCFQKLIKVGDLVWIAWIGELGISDRDNNEGLSVELPSLWGHAGVIRESPNGLPWETPSRINLV